MPKLSLKQKQMLEDKFTKDPIWNIKESSARALLKGLGFGSTSAKEALRDKFDLKTNDLFELAYTLLNEIFCKRYHYKGIVLIPLENINKFDDLDKSDKLKNLERYKYTNLNTAAICTVRLGKLFYIAIMDSREPDFMKPPFYVWQGGLQLRLYIQNVELFSKNFGDLTDVLQ